jgi:hypothetical protein
VLGPDEARAEACHRLEAAERALDPLGAAGQPLDEMVRSLMGPGMASVLTLARPSRGRRGDGESPDRRRWRRPSRAAPA